MESILSHVEQGVMTITLNRPERLNSFNDVMHQQLSECLKQAERDDAIRCLLITGQDAVSAPGRISTTVTSTRTARRPIWACPLRLLQPAGAPPGKTAEAGDLRG